MQWIFDHRPGKAQTLNVKEMGLQFLNLVDPAFDLFTGQYFVTQGNRVPSYLPWVADFESSGRLVIAGLPAECACDALISLHHY